MLICQFANRQIINGAKLLQRRGKEKDTEFFGYLTDIREDDSLPCKGNYIGIGAFAVINYIVVDSEGERLAGVAYYQHFLLGYQGDHVTALLVKADELLAGILRQIVDGQGYLYIEVIVVVLLFDTHLAVIRRGVMQVDTQQIAVFIGGKGAHILIETERIGIKQEHVRYFAREGFGEVAEFHTNLVRAARAIYQFGAKVGRFGVLRKDGWEVRDKR